MEEAIYEFVILRFPQLRIATTNEPLIRQRANYEAKMGLVPQRKPPLYAYIELYFVHSRCRSLYQAS